MRYSLIVTIILTVSTILFVGCSNSRKQSNIVHYKVTVEALYGGKEVSGEAIYFKPLATGRMAYPRGEAVVIGLDGNRRAYMPTIDRNILDVHGALLKSVYDQTTSLDESSQSMQDKVSTLQALPLGQKIKYDYHGISKPSTVPKLGFPLIVGFKNEQDPSSVFAIDTEKTVSVFGKPFKFKAIYVERVDEASPLTDTIGQHLKWVDANHEIWQRRYDAGYVGHSLKPMKANLSGDDAVFGHKIQRYYFKQMPRR